MSIHNYRDFTIFAEEISEVERDQNGPPRKFSLRIFDSPVGEGEFGEEVTINDWEKIEKWRTALAKRTISPKDLIEFARRLGTIILPPYARGLYKRSLDKLEEGEGLRVRLRLTQELAFLPWEYALVELHGGEPTAEDYWALDFRISIVRHEAIDRPAAPFRSTATRRVIFATASPKPYEKYPELRLSEEQKAIKEQLNKVHGVLAEYHPDFKTEKDSKGITQDEIQELLKEPADIFYFSGHGIFRKDPQTTHGHGAIIIADENNKAQELQADILSGMLAEGHIRLVILDACESGERDRYQQWSSVALALLKAGIPAVVAMQFSIYDDLTKEFSRILYGYLVAGLTIDEAVAQGRRAVYRADSKQRDWGSPVLYMRNAGGNIFPPVTDEQVRLEAVRISEQDATLSSVMMRWAREGGLASKAQLEFLKQGGDSVQFTPLDAVLLLRSAVEYDQYSNDWVEVLRKVGLAWLGQVHTREHVTAETEMDLAEKQLGLDAQILNPAPEKVGNLTWSAVSNGDTRTAQTAALALLALGPETVINQIQEALQEISDTGLRRRRRAVLLGTLAEADPKMATILPKEIDNIQDRLAVWWWRVRKNVRRDQAQIRQWSLGGAIGGALALAVLRAFLAIFNSRPMGSEFAVNSYWGFIVGLGLVFGIVLAGPLMLQNSMVPEPGQERRLDTLAILLGGLGFSVANGLVAWMTGLGLSLAMFFRFVLTTFCSGMGLSLGLFKQPRAGWLLGAGGWLKRLAMAAIALALLQSPVLCEAATKPGGGYWLDNAQWTISAITETSQSIVNKYSFYPFLNTRFNRCVAVETGTCCFACSSSATKPSTTGFLSTCLAQWLSVIDAALVGVVMTLGITAGIHFSQTRLSRFWTRLRARWGGG
jgi:hypothetical protein